MKSIKFAAMVFAFVLSSQANAWNAFSSLFSDEINPANRLDYGTVVSMEPSNLKGTAAGEQQTPDAYAAGGQVGAMVTGGSVVGILVGSVAGIAGSVIGHNLQSKIDGYDIVVLKDNGEKIYTSKATSYVHTYKIELGKRVSVITSPKGVISLLHTDITKEQAPAEIARRAPHQVQEENAVTTTNSTESTMASQPSGVVTPVTDGEEVKTTPDTISTPKALDAPSHAASNF